MTARDQSDERRWAGASAMHGSDAEPDRWVVWGTGPVPKAPEGAVDLEPGDEIARGIARGADPEWDDTQGWVLVVVGEETSVDELTSAEKSVRGYAPFLAAGRREEAADRPMRGVLRSDVAPRRKVDQPRPS